MPRDKSSAESEKTAYNAGAEAFNRSQDSANNPYPKDSEQAKSWEQGFLDAQKAVSHGAGNTASPSS
jgi:hypothetical protein